MALTTADGDDDFDPVSGDNYRPGMAALGHNFAIAFDSKPLPAQSEALKELCDGGFCRNSFLNAVDGDLDHGIHAIGACDSIMRATMPIEARAG